MAKNDITNDEIRSKPYSLSYGDGWEKIYLKKPQEWLDSCYPNLFIKSLDGFRWGEESYWEKPMKKSEFEYRLAQCTVLNNLL